MPEQDSNATGTTASSTDTPAAAEHAQVEDVLVEEVSIDGMCGVY